MLLISSFCISSCKKYLDAKPDKSLSTISSIEGLQGFLDDYRIMNQRCTQATAIASDNYYLTDDLYTKLRTEEGREAYLWKSGVFKYEANDWLNEYNIVYMANIVLDGLKKIDKTARNAAAWDNCKGSALVYRAKSFFEIAQVWSKAYDSFTAAKDLGIPLRLTSDFNVPSVRSSNENTYLQIIKDLKQAVPLLPNSSDNVLRPSKPAAYGLLARTYLAMGKYSQAKLYADSCLAINNQILDFNSLDPTSSSPFGPILYTNPEDIMHSRINRGVKIMLVYVYARIDSLLYESYDSNDLRKSIYFRTNADGSHGFKAAYENANQFYNGLATDEIYLTRAECLAREGDVANAMKDLNKLLINRWKTGTFVPYTADNSSDALNKILLERRKELFYRMLRFTDIKRLNKEGTNITLKRFIGGKTYILPPNDSRYALPIPDLVIQRSGMQQN